jgi:hypothetical protein
MKKLLWLVCLLISFNWIFAQGSYLRPVSNEALFYKGLKVSTAQELKFRDDSLYIESGSDGNLLINADTAIRLRATTLTMSGALTMGGALSTGSNNLTTGTGFWATCPLANLVHPDLASVYYEDFVGVKLDSAGVAWHDEAQIATNATLAGWKTAGDAGWTLTQAAGTLDGILTVTHVTGSNNEFYTQLGELGTETIIEYTKSSANESWIEFRFADTDITASAGNFFVGLAEEGSAAANFINDSGADIADKDVIGFVQWEANEDTVQVLYQTAGGAFVDTFAVAITTAEMALQIYFDGDSTLTFYKDGTSLGTLLTTASLFPDGEELSPIIATKGGAQDRVLNFNWIKTVQER